MLFDSLVVWLKEWQFLSGTLVALVAAALTVNAINRQIRLQRLEADDRRRRLVRALRASMPEDLNGICSYTRRSAEVGREALLVIGAQEEGQGTRGHKLRCPTLPAYVLLNLKALTENLDHANAEQVADLLGCYYAQRARLISALENFDRSNSGTVSISRDVNLNSVFKNTLELYLRAEGMLKFAKGEVENITGAFDNNDVLNALKRLNLDHVLSPEAREYCLKFLSVKIRARERERPAT